MSNEEKTKGEFWKHFIEAVDADPRSATSIRGASGWSHPVLAVGVDERQSRLVIISGEHDARSAVMAQADIQAAVTPLRVVIARPAAVNLGRAASALVEAAGSPVVAVQAFAKLEGEEGKALLEQFVKPYLDPIARAFKIGDLSVLPQILQVVQQLAKIEFVQPQDPNVEFPNSLAFQLESLANFDPIQADREVGICPVPLYDFSEEESEAIARGQGHDHIREILRRHDLLQYFYPPPDQLALGLLERGIKDPGALIEQINAAQAIGHPLAEPELVDKVSSPIDVIDQLRVRKLLVEGEIGYEVSEEARCSRVTIKFKPREGLISKLINRFTVNLDLKDLFK